MKTKVSFLLFICALFVSPVLAQDDEGIVTLFGNNDKIDHGGWGGFSMGYSKIGEQDAFISGGRGGWLIDHRLTIGGGGYGFYTNFNHSNISSPTADNYSLAGGYGGLLLEPVIAPFNPVHISIPVLIGGGEAGVVDEYAYHGHSDYTAYGPYFVLEAGIDIEMNIVKFFRLAVYGSYRYTSDLDIDYQSADGLTQFSVPSDALRGFNCGLTFKFGKF